MICAVIPKTTAHQLRNPICAVVMGRLKKKVTAQLRKPTIFTGAPTAHQLRKPLQQAEKTADRTADDSHAPKASQKTSCFAE